MNKLLLAGLSVALITLGACNNNAPSTEAEYIEALAKYRSCPTASVLKDITSFSSDFGDTSLGQAEWFEANGKRKDVVTTASGLQYSVNKASKIKTNVPQLSESVRVNYHGLFFSGDIFDSSFDRGEDISFPLDKVIRGWTEGVGLMRPCDAWTFYIPSSLAYGVNGKGSIPGNTPLIFHVQLLGTSVNF
ncbi:MAG: peptidylprolyl isomerase [Robiginitomaculum sp.]|nr:MAG: peptidylprolyl isomerase [Robiginitomaculum sp.]